MFRSLCCSRSVFRALFQWLGGINLVKLETTYKWSQWLPDVNVSWNSGRLDPSSGTPSVKKHFDFGLVNPAWSRRNTAITLLAWVPDCNMGYTHARGKIMLEWFVHYLWRTLDGQCKGYRDRGDQGEYQDEGSSDCRVRTHCDIVCHVIR